MHPKHRRPVNTVARPLLQTIWQRTAEHCGAKSGAEHTPMRLVPAAAAVHAEMDDQVGLLRTDRRFQGYGLRTVLGKSIYWLPGYAALVAMCEHAVRGHGPRSGPTSAKKRTSALCDFSNCGLRWPVQCWMRKQVRKQLVDETRKGILSTECERSRACLRSGGSAPLLPAANHHTHNLAQQAGQVSDTPNRDSRRCFAAATNGVAAPG